MNLNYCITNGKITQEDGTLVATGWAGHGAGKNNPEMVSVKDVGPLPPGTYQVGAWGLHGEVGPLSAILTQIQGETYGRNDFLIHGPDMDASKYGEESKGCIVVPRTDRLRVIALKPQTITVVA